MSNLAPVHLFYTMAAMMTFHSCAPALNFEQPMFPAENEGRFVATRDGLRLFVYDYIPRKNYSATIFVIAGITGINQQKEKELLDELSGKKNRVVVIHPRGTGYSDGERGCIRDFNAFITDYTEIIAADADYGSRDRKVFLFGHSMGCAVLLAAADTLHGIGGAILVNPPFLRKAAKGMSPSAWQYAKYAFYYLFSKHSPVVNMAGNPAEIEDEDDRKESEMRQNDQLLVQYCSMYMMSESKKIMDRMPDYSRSAKYPLLLVRGEKDNIVDLKGCDMIFNSWGCPDKQRVSVENGAHGSLTVIRAGKNISAWIAAKTNQDAENG